MWIDECYNVLLAWDKTKSDIGAIKVGVIALRCENGGWVITPIIWNKI